MKRVILAVGALSLAMTHSTLKADADEDWASHLEVSAEAKGGELRVVLQGREGWYVNTKFPLKVVVKAPDGVTLDKAELGRDDAQLEGTEHEGKAKRATLRVKYKGSAKSFEGSYKAVICSTNACSPPLKGAWVGR